MSIDAAHTNPWATRTGMMRILVALFAIGLMPAQQLPGFEDYPVKEIFEGIPAAPILDTAEKRLFRTRIREGVIKGIGVTRSGLERPGSNFAGHYIIVEWQCGSPCGMMAIVDAVSGLVYSLPLSKGLQLPEHALGPPCMDWGYATVKFRQDSSLMTVEACPWGEHANYLYYYLWEGSRWKLLRRVPACAGRESQRLVLPTC